jgi:hypothetical protein
MCMWDRDERGAEERAELRQCRDKGSGFDTVVCIRSRTILRALAMLLVLLMPFNAPMPWLRLSLQGLLYTHARKAALE